MRRERGEKFVCLFFNHGFGQWLNLAQLLISGTLIQNWKALSTAFVDLKIWHKPMAAARQTFPHMSICRTVIPAGDGVMAESMEHIQHAL